jgi:hypothetical protein
MAHAMCLLQSAVRVQGREAKKTIFKLTFCLSAASEGRESCDAGLIPRMPPPSMRSLFPLEPNCLPAVIPCGEGPGAKCCTDGPACVDSDGFEASLTCIEGLCERCGARGLPPCDGVPLRHCFTSFQFLL